MSYMKLLITGGHLTPALAVIEKLESKTKTLNMVYVGRKYSSDFEKTISLEYQEITRHKIPFKNLPAGRFTRLVNAKSLINALRIPYGFVRAAKIIREEKPDAILSFGGFIALPIAMVGRLFRIPVYTHEQTLNPGFANKLIGKIAKKVFVSFEETEKYFPSGKTRTVGNPIRQGIFKVIKKPFEIEKNKQVIYVTGGSLGSHSVNVLIEKNLQELLKKYIIIHQTGAIKEYHDFERLTEISSKLPGELKKNYFLKEHFLEDEAGYIYQMTDLVVGRSGANTFFELIALKKPAILIPLPWSSGREQERQAEIFAKNGLGEIFQQSEPPKKLFDLINFVFENLEKYKNSFTKLKKFYTTDAAEKITENILV